ncbi:beta-1,3-galactosyltransferase 1-like, partial [Asterias rubens]|uniref:beta-1,3-galactosyltransferase 1-like n=1 Tax=Asterias rubens TaxID=7604 RepID=UPI0014555A11
FVEIFIIFIIIILCFRTTTTTTTTTTATTTATTPTKTTTAATTTTTITIDDIRILHRLNMRLFRRGRCKYFCLTLVYILVVYVIFNNIPISIFNRHECDPYLKMKDGKQFHHTFFLAEPQTCFHASSSHPRPVFLLVVIASSGDNFERRQAIRETWGSPKEIMGRGIVTVFLLGEEPLEKFSPETRDLLQDESAAHHDILQADFIDTYKNLTIKTIVGLKWIHAYCSHASYFMKTDDDMYISYANLVKNLSAPSTPTTDFAMGHLFENNFASRSFHNKFYMPRCMFPEKFYPPYLAGSGYVMSGDLAGKIFRTALYSNFVYFEDVFVGVCFRTLGVKPTGHSGFNFIHIGYEFCKYRNDVVSSHGVETKEMHDIWNDLQNSETKCLPST